MKSSWASRFGVAVALLGCGITVLGLGMYQAWWAIAFAIGGVAVSFWAQRQGQVLRPLVAGVSIIGALLLLGMGMFLLYGGMSGPAVPCIECPDTQWQWFAASAGSIVVALLLVAFARRLLRTPRSLE
jgi:hypothetical protein